MKIIPFLRGLFGLQKKLTSSSHLLQKISKIKKNVPCSNESIKIDNIVLKVSINLPLKFSKSIITKQKNLLCSAWIDYPKLDSCMISNHKQTLANIKSNTLVNRFSTLVEKNCNILFEMKPENLKMKFHQKSEVGFSDSSWFWNEIEEYRRVHHNLKVENLRKELKNFVRHIDTRELEQKKTDDELPLRHVEDKVILQTDQTKEPMCVGSGLDPILSVQTHHAIVPDKDVAKKKVHNKMIPKNPECCTALKRNFRNTKNNKENIPVMENKEKNQSSEKIVYDKFGTSKNTKETEECSDCDKWKVMYENCLKKKAVLKSLDNTKSNRPMDEPQSLKANKHRINYTMRKNKKYKTPAKEYSQGIVVVDKPKKDKSQKKKFFYSSRSGTDMIHEKEPKIIANEQNEPRLDHVFQNTKSPNQQENHNESVSITNKSPYLQQKYKETVNMLKEKDPVIMSLKRINSFKHPLKSTNKVWRNMCYDLDAPGDQPNKVAFKIRKVANKCPLNSKLRNETPSYVEIKSLENNNKKEQKISSPDLLGMKSTENDLSNRLSKPPTDSPLAITPAQVIASLTDSHLKSDNNKSDRLKLKANTPQNTDFKGLVTEKHYSWNDCKKHTTILEAKQKPTNLDVHDAKGKTTEVKENVQHNIVQTSKAIEKGLVNLPTLSANKIQVPYLKRSDSRIYSNKNPDKYTSNSLINESEVDKLISVKTAQFCKILLELVKLFSACALQDIEKAKYQKRKNHFNVKTDNFLQNYGQKENNKRDEDMKN